MEAINLDDKYNEIFRQYDLKVFNMYRARGAFMLETNQGLKLLKNFEGSKNHLEYENIIKETLYDRGFKNVDLLLRNKVGELITQDAASNKFIIKNWFLGEECNLRDLNDIKKAAYSLGNLHKALSHVKIPEEYQYTQSNSIELYEKHNRELKRVRTYVRDKKQRNDFELSFLNSYETFYEQGIKAVEILKKSNYDFLYQEALSNSMICHGNYTYHNIICMKDGTAITNYEKATKGLQIYDLYQLIRKTMEKNNWNQEYGAAIIQEYEKERTLSEESFTILYVLLLYPEKFWKIMNYYYNNKKCWISQRNIQKLHSLIEQRDVKNAFLKNFYQYK